MKLDRLISILVILLRRERVKAKQWAEMFEVSVRTILRDVDTLNLAGIPIVTYQGINGGIGIAEGYRLDRTVLTSNDMAAVISALKAIDSSLYDHSHEVLMEKLKNTLSPTQLQSLEMKTKQFIVDLSPWGNDESLIEKAQTLRKAIEDCREVELIYIDAVGSETGREVEPYSLLIKGQQWYLYAWCLLRQDFRLFKLTRIRKMTVSTVSYKPREIYLEQDPFENTWDNPDYLVELNLLFEKEMQGIIGDWFGRDIVELEDGRLMAKALFPENNWLYGFLLSFGLGVEVVSPSHIRDKLKGIAEEIYKKYSL